MIVWPSYDIKVRSYCVGNLKIPARSNGLENDRQLFRLRRQQFHYAPRCNGKQKKNAQRWLAAVVVAAAAVVVVTADVVLRKLIR